MELINWFENRVNYLEDLLKLSTGRHIVIVTDKLNDAKFILERLRDENQPTNTTATRQRDKTVC